MSDTDSDLSTDGDNNNVSPFFNHYLGHLGNSLRFAYEVDNIESLPFDTDTSSGSETNLINHTDTSSSGVSFQSPYLIYLILILIL